MLIRAGEHNQLILSQYHLILNFLEDAKNNQADPSKAKKKPEPDPVKGIKPKFSKLLTHDVAEDGRSVRFDCKITADPEPDVQWYDDCVFFMWEWNSCLLVVKFVSIITLHRKHRQQSSSPPVAAFYN